MQHTALTNGSHSQPLHFGIPCIVSPTSLPHTTSLFQSGKLLFRLLTLASFSSQTLASRKHSLTPHHTHVLASTWIPLTFHVLPSSTHLYMQPWATYLAISCKRHQQRYRQNHWGIINRGAKYALKSLVFSACMGQVSICNNLKECCHNSEKDHCCQSSLGSLQQSQHLTEVYLLYCPHYSLLYVL